MYQYEDAMADYYDLGSLGLAGDTDFYVGEARKVTPPVLELGCGTGRILLPMAQAGVDVVGLDSSRRMLEIARRKIEAEDGVVRDRIELAEGDMRDFDLGRRFELAIIPYRAFLHLMTPEDQRRALLRIRDHLTENGRLIFNIFDFRFHMVADHLGPLGTALKKQSDLVNPETGRRVVVWASVKYDPETQVVTEDRIFEEIDQQGTVVQRCYGQLALRWAYRHEMQYLLELCGYEVEALYGDFARGPYRYGGEQVWVARKA